MNHALDRNQSLRVLVLDDFSTFKFTNDLTAILAADKYGGGGKEKNEMLNNLINKLTNDNVYAYSQSSR